MSISAQQIFDAIPSRFNGAAAGGWNAVIQFALTGDGGGDWYVTVQNAACTVTAGKAEKPTATVRTSAQTWVGMVSGTVNPMNAFMSGQLTVQGNIGDVMKLQSPEVFRKA